MPESWRKSSYSNGGNGNCVEIAVRAEAIAIRDSKNVTGPTLEFSVDQWRTFLTTTR